ncbi:serine/threonine-protein kinase pim-2-like [Sinocyclocheilus grahami]|uniref:serine/threonine-protein kinase pim-2-like n=1 Tax=Sinocyclocheilus grahami TaxID=75366 RepID=UPI0007ACD797|nr:PREDICTED: serine/threonine-protein kinase pim-2-like [Sinocyclocheilus grahami]
MCGAELSSAVRPKDDGGIACAVRPKVDRDVARAVHPKVDGGIASAERRKPDKGIASTGRPKVNKGIASKECPKVDKGITSKGRPKVDVGIASAKHPQVYRGIASAVRTQVDSVPTGELDKDHICWRYKFGARLGEGGFGSVRKGTRYKDSLKVAVKYVQKTKHTTYISTAFHPKPLPLEIALAVIINRKPNCPHIIEMLDWQDDPDYYLIVLERPVPSMDMGKFLKCSGGVLSEQIAQYLMWQVIYAANFCCYRGVFHRDIKLENVLVNPTTLEIKLIDFGCGDLVKDSGYSACCGTKPYFSPEYHDRGRYHAKPATVYSLGVLLFAMLHGRFPKARDLYCLGINQSVFAVSHECIRFLWAGLQRHPEHRIALEQMLYLDWFVLGFPNPLPINRNASKQHSCHR